MDKVILGISIIWSIGQILRIRNRAAGGGIMIPPLIISHLVFTLSVVGVMILRVSPFHLLWLFVASFPLGILLLFVPFVQRMTMNFVALLMMTKRWREETAQPLRKRRRRRKGGNRANRGKIR